jgi:hypothetical protein
MSKDDFISVTLLLLLWQNPKANADQYEHFVSLAEKLWNAKNKKR